MEASLIRCCRSLFQSRTQYDKLVRLNGHWNCIVRGLSSATEVKTGEARSVFRTSENDPRKHTLEHVGLYYTVDEKERIDLLKGCIHNWHKHAMNSFNESCLMVRKPFLEIQGYLRNLNVDHPVPRFIIYGKRGNGKQITLGQVLQSCHRDGWIILHVPWAGRWNRGWKKEVAESTYKPGRYDLPNDAAIWLRHFRRQNKDKLQDLKTTSEYIWTKREKAEAGTSFDEIIDFGLSRIKFSSDCLGVILKEIRQQAATKGIKVLVAVNKVNGFFVEWNYINSLRNPEKRVLQPGEISLIHNFKKMLSPTWSHGAVVCTADHGTNPLTLRESDTPLYLLGQEGFEALDPFVPILVPEYTEKEALSTIDYYIDRNWIQSEHAKTDEGKKEIMFVSNNNPFQLYRTCSQL